MSNARHDGTPHAHNSWQVPLVNMAVKGLNSMKGAWTAEKCIFSRCLNVSRDGYRCTSDRKGMTSNSIKNATTTNTIINTTLLLRYNMMVKRLKVKRYSSRKQVISELRGVTCHMGSHSVTCYPTQVNLPHKFICSITDPSQTGWYSMNLPQMDRRLSWPSWLDTYWNGLPVTHPSSNCVRCRGTTVA